MASIGRCIVHYIEETQMSLATYTDYINACQSGDGQACVDISAGMVPMPSGGITAPSIVATGPVGQTIVAGNTGTAKASPFGNLTQQQLVFLAGAAILAFALIASPSGKR